MQQIDSKQGFTATFKPISTEGNKSSEGKEERKTVNLDTVRQIQEPFFGKNSNSSPQKADSLHINSHLADNKNQLLKTGSSEMPRIIKPKSDLTKDQNQNSPTLNRKSIPKQSRQSDSPVFERKPTSSFGSKSPEASLFQLAGGFYPQKDNLPDFQENLPAFNGRSTPQSLNEDEPVRKGSFADIAKAALQHSQSKDNIETYSNAKSQANPPDQKFALIDEDDPLLR